MACIRGKVVILVLVVVIALSLLGAGGYFFYYKSPEQMAIRVVNEHLSSLKTGKGNPYSTVDILLVREVFINVLDYKYLSTLKSEVIERTVTYGPTDWLKPENKNRFQYLGEYLDWQERQFPPENVTRVGNAVVLKTGRRQQEFAFLYDVVITNRLGQQLFKKYVFEVKPKSFGSDDYRIVAYYEH